MPKLRRSSVGKSVGQVVRPVVVTQPQPTGHAVADEARSVRGCPDYGRWHQRVEDLIVRFEHRFSEEYSAFISLGDDFPVDVLTVDHAGTLQTAQYDRAQSEPAALTRPGGAGRGVGLISLR